MRKWMNRVRILPDELCGIVFEYTMPVQIQVLHQIIRFVNPDFTGDHLSWFLEQIATSVGAPAHISTRSSSFYEKSLYTKAFANEGFQPITKFGNLIFDSPAGSNNYTQIFLGISDPGQQEAILLSQTYGDATFIIPFPGILGPDKWLVTSDWEEKKTAIWVAGWNGTSIFLNRFTKKDSHITWNESSWKRFEIPGHYLEFDELECHICVHVCSRRVFVLFNREEDYDEYFDLRIMAIPFDVFGCEEIEYVETNRKRADYVSLESDDDDDGNEQA